MLQRVAVFDHVIDRVFPVALDRHVDVGAEGRAHQVHALDQAADIAVGQLIGVAVMARLLEVRVGGGRHRVALHLERGKAEGIVGLGLLRLAAPGGGFGRVTLRRLQGAIEPHLVAETPAQQIAHRRLQQPPRQIP